MGRHLDTHQTVSKDSDVEMPAMPVTYDMRNARSEECCCASLGMAASFSHRARSDAPSAGFAAPVECIELCCPQMDGQHHTHRFSAAVPLFTAPHVGVLETALASELRACALTDEVCVLLLMGWGLCLEIVFHIWHIFGLASVDLFAAGEITGCPLWYSVRRESTLSLGVDAWPPGLLYAFPPVVQMLSLIHSVRAEGRAVAVVVPVVPSAHWFPLLVRRAVLPPWLVPLRQDALSQAGGLVHRPPLLRVGRLMVWLTQGCDGNPVDSPPLWSPLCRMHGLLPLLSVIEPSGNVSGYGAVMHRWIHTHAHCLVCSSSSILCW